MDESIALESDFGAEVYGPNTLIVMFDDSGHEAFADKSHPVFGLGGCAAMARDYNRLINSPWTYMCNKFFPDRQRPMHASEMNFTSGQINALNHFFTKFEFFRFACVASANTKNHTEAAIISTVSACLLQRIVAIAKYATFDRIIVIFEASDRIERKVFSEFVNKSLEFGDKEIPIELATMPKSSCLSGLEVADFIVHTASGQVRARMKSDKVVRRDFEKIFRSVDKRLVSFMEILKITAATSAK